MQLLKVFAPNGDVFEVQPHVARELVVDKGWTFNYPPKPVFKAKKVDAPEVRVRVDAAPRKSDK